MVSLKLAHLFLIGSLSNLLVTRTGIKSWTSSKSGWIGSVTSELHALEAHWWAYSIGRLRCPSVVVRWRPLSVCPPFSKIFFSKTARPIEAKFHIVPQWDGGTKVCLRGLGHMTEWPPRPYEVNTQQKFLLQYQRANDFVPWYVALGTWAHHS